MMDACGAGNVPARESGPAARLLSFEQPRSRPSSSKFSQEAPAMPSAQMCHPCVWPLQANLEHFFGGPGLRCLPQTSLMKLQQCHQLRCAIHVWPLLADLEHFFGGFQVCDVSPRLLS